MLLAVEHPLVYTPVDHDNALILDCLAGNADSFGILVARHRDGVTNFVRHTVGIEADAQDLSQEAFISAYGALARFRIGSPFEPWIYRIAANLCISYFRRAKRRPQSLDTDYLSRTLSAAAHSDPAQALLAKDQHRRLLAAIQRLPVEQRMVVVLRHLQDRSYREIADMLHIPVSTVEHRLRAARLVLSQQFSEDLPQAGGRR